MTTALASHPLALEAWQRDQEDLFGEVFAPRPHLRPSELAEEKRILSQGPSVGRRWSNAQTPYLVEIMDFVGDPWARIGYVRKSTRTGYTEGVIGNVLLWTVLHDPCPIAIVHPSDKEAESYSKEQITPMIELNPDLKAKLGALGTRASDSTITYKEFSNGYLTIFGATSDKNLRRRSLKRVLVDEVDGMKVENKEGDVIQRLRKRTDDFADDGGVVLVGSTPTVKGLSRIDRGFGGGDQRFWKVPCPMCKEPQVLRWGGPEKRFGIKWDREVSCRGCGVVLEEQRVEQCPDCGGRQFDTKHLPETGYYQCEFCGEAIDHDEKAAMVQAGAWVPSAPGASYPSWHMDSLISLFPAANW